MKVVYILLPSPILLILSGSSCEEDKLPGVKVPPACGGREVLETFEDKYLRFVITEARQTEAVASWFHLDSTSNAITEYRSCVLHKYELESSKIVKVSGKIFMQTGNSVLNFIQVENYRIVDYCTPSFKIKSGEFTIENRWEILSLQTSDTVLYVPCEAYPPGAFLIIDNGMLFGSTGTETREV